MKKITVRDMKIRTKLMLLGLVSVLSVLIVGTESVRTAHQIDNMGGRISSVWMQAVVVAGELNTLTANYRIEESRHAITTDDEMMSDIERNLERRQEEINSRFQEFSELATSQEDQDLMKEVRSVWEQYLKASGEVLRVSRGNDRYKTLDALLGDSQSLFTQTNKLLNQVVECTELETETARAAAKEMYSKLNNLKILMLVLVLVLVVWLSRYLIESIEKPTEELVDVARRATNGNLDLHMNFTAKDEIGLVGDAVKQLIARLRNIVEDETMMFHEISNGNLSAKSGCEQAYRGDFAPILYSFTSLQSRLKEARQNHENEVDKLKTRIRELEQQVLELDGEVEDDDD